MSAQPVLRVVATAAGGVETLRTGLVEPALAANWRVTVTLTPTAARWLTHAGEVDRLASATGLPVRWDSRLPTEPRPHPDADLAVLAPASANSVAKLALGIADNQALTQLCEALGDPRVPVVVWPRTNAFHAAHPAWNGHLATLRSAGAHLVDAAVADDGTPPWGAVLDAIASAHGT
ncbi:Flavoprotein [Streptoalloteichus tenebrarius]|uniref:Flavoprotein n=1 Tax=Streptoalloteichus tenebrarius (strain ATCC 17920 / DSM 40477 / JCM 4838 / CBS 697.72 / NBRC 16177 / NCIMB 11028 / NRRL B-12390 / A12253. 1 / ISP 5477) TaxID=1933 RepID=A0ABT1HYE1_STRSD|nr:flavoprotein [Streptoalloteichus tenebrarius]MCP2260375.1 Flavoprotein [Streptoalloteichus tenebrarius]BFF02516.1 flavoprotein [Streptoalloteichus tenebrarius]